MQYCDYVAKAVEIGSCDRSAKKSRFIETLTTARDLHTAKGIMDDSILEYPVANAAVDIASKSNEVGLFILNEVRRKLALSVETGEVQRAMLLYIAAGIINRQGVVEVPREVFSEAFRVLGENNKYNWLAYSIYQHSGLRAELAVREFARAGVDAVAATVEMEKTEKKRPEFSALICFAAFGSNGTFRAAADELIKQGRQYDLGEAARRSVWERAKEIMDIAVKAKLWDVLIFAGNNDDRRARQYEMALFRENATVADADASAEGKNWAALSRMF
jgi:hypothetical protein